MTSRAMKAVIRSLAATKTIIPARENSASGNTSVCSWRAVVASASAGLPGTDAAEAANAVTPLPRSRSAKTSRLSRPNTSRDAHIR